VVEAQRPAVDDSVEPAVDGEVEISVVIPVYNGERSLPELLDRIRSVLADRGRPFEIVLVNDSSSDESWSVIRGEAREHVETRGLSLSRNYGQHNALLAGILDARGSVIVTMDDDLEHRPEELPLLLDALTADIDLVYGYPADEVHGLLRDLSSRLVKASMAGVLGEDVSRHLSAFRVFRSDLTEAFSSNRDPFVSLDVLLSWATTKVLTIEVVMDPRRYGASNYSFRTLLRHAINMITGYSSLPLRLVSYTGFGFALFGMALLAYVVINALIRQESVPGFGFLAASIALFSGAQLFALGMLGEYLGRMHFRSMGRPVFVVRERVGHVP